MWVAILVRTHGQVLRKLKVLWTALFGKELLCLEAHQLFTDKDEGSCCSVVLRSRRGLGLMKACFRFD